MMRNRLSKKLTIWFCLWAVLLSPGVVSAAPIEADRIVAIVNDEVITLSELRSRLTSALAQLKRQGTPLPPAEVLERQMLERLVVDRIQLQSARELGVRIDDGQLDQALNRIAQANKVSLPQFKASLEADGIAFPRFREEIRAEMTIARLREREVENRLQVSDAEIDNYLSADNSAEGNEEVHLAHILLRTPEAASPDQLQKLRLKAEQVMARIKQGEDFAQLAATYSDAQDALQGGDLGVRALERLPSLYAEAIAHLKPGEVTPILKSANGFHIVRVLKRSDVKQLAPVEQTKARHILIKINELVSEDEVLHKMTSLRERLVHGEDFAELARRYSQDASASKGGDLGWIYPGDTVPEFEQAMNRLAPGEFSSAVKSPFGYHLIQVLERRLQEVSRERQRMAARQTLRERKLDDAYQDWLRQLRDRAYVEYRYEEL